jgi:flagellar motor switch protein FliM
VKPDHAFIAERRAAQHCAELLRSGPQPGDMLARFAQLGERFARQLALELAPLLGGETPSVTAQAPREMNESELHAEVGPLAANGLYSTGVPGVALLASLEGAAPLRLVDRAFGGQGEAPTVLPDAYPLSAELMIAKLETLLAQSLSTALGYRELGAVVATRRDARLTELAPFPAGARLAVLRCEVTEENRRPWLVALALPMVLLTKLFASGDGPRDPADHAPHSADPAAQPFADVALPLRAVLVDMPVSLATLSGLEPGMVLPVIVARSVPLKIGEVTLAYGSIGAQDDQIALKLTQIAG